MALVLIGFIVGTVSAILAMLLGFAWWQVFVIYVGAGNIGLVIAAIALAVTPDDELERHGGQTNALPEPSPVLRSQPSSLAGFGTSNSAMLAQDMRSGGETLFDRRPNGEPPVSSCPNPAPSVSKL